MGIIIIIVSAIMLLPSVTKNNEITLAKQFIENSPVISPGDFSSTVGQNKRVLINLAQYQPEKFDDTINNIKALLTNNESDKSFHIEIIASKKGLKVLDLKTSRHLEQINQLSNQFNNLKVIACAKSLTTLLAEGDPIQLSKAVIFTPSTAQQVAKRTKEGWLYVKL